MYFNAKQFKGEHFQDVKKRKWTSIEEYLDGALSQRD